MEIIGDFSTADMKAKLEQVLGSWKYTQPAVPAFPEGGKQGQPGVFLASKDDTTQTFFHVGELGGELRDKDYPALEVASEILGGGFSSRLFRSVRTKHGWAYNISASWSANYDHPGTFDHLGQHAIGAHRGHSEGDRRGTGEDPHHRSHRRRAADRQRHRAERLRLQFRPSQQNHQPADDLPILRLSQGFHLPVSEGDCGVTKADVLRVAQQYFQPKNLSYVAVGNPKDFGTPLASLGMKVAPDRPDHSRAKAAGRAGRPGIARQGQSAFSSECSKRWAAPTSWPPSKICNFTPTWKYSLPGASMKVKQTNSFIAPSTVRQDNELPFMKQSVYSDGTSGWLAGMQGVQTLTPPVLKQIHGEAFRQIASLALSDRDADRTVKPGRRWRARNFIQGRRKRPHDSG
jgi:hypothetical protein